MRTLMLLVLTVVAVSELTVCQPVPKKNEISVSSKRKSLLKEIISKVDQMQKRKSKMNLTQYVKDVIPNVGCSSKHLCQAATVMRNTTLNITMLHRQLSAYANISGQHNCSVQASQDDIKLNDFLTKIKICCQALYSEP